MLASHFDRGDKQVASLAHFQMQDIRASVVTAWVKLHPTGGNLFHAEDEKTSGQKNEAGLPARAQRKQDNPAYGNPHAAALLQILMSPRST